MTADHERLRSFCFIAIAVGLCVAMAWVLIPHPSRVVMPPGAPPVPLPPDLEQFLESEVRVLVPETLARGVPVAIDVTYGVLPYLMPPNLALGLASSDSEEVFAAWIIDVSHPMVDEHCLALSQLQAASIPDSGEWLGAHEVRVAVFQSALGYGDASYLRPAVQPSQLGSRLTPWRSVAVHIARHEDIAARDLAESEAAHLLSEGRLAIVTDTRCREGRILASVQTRGLDTLLRDIPTAQIEIRDGDECVATFDVYCSSGELNDWAFWRELHIDSAVMERLRSASVVATVRVTNEMLDRYAGPRPQFVGSAEVGRVVVVD